MAKTANWNTRVGRRVRLQNLHMLFLTVVQSGSMAKAAAHLGVAQPTVSKAIGDLEAVLGVRLLDRSPQGIAPTLYGDALLKCDSAAFDELTLGIRNIEFLCDPNVEELRIGSSEAISGATLPIIIHQFLQKYPHATIEVDDIPLAPFSFAPRLRERTLDLVLYQAGRTLTGGGVISDFNIEILFYDQLVVAVGNESPWARRRKIDLAELIDEPWILASADSWNYRIVAEAFRARGIEMPRIRLKTLSVALRAKLMATGRYIAVISNLVVHSYADRFSMKILPLELPCRPWPVAIITLKNRTLSPVAERFIECAHNVAKSFPTLPPP